MSQIFIQVTNSLMPWHQLIFCLHFEMVATKNIPENKTNILVEFGLSGVYGSRCH